MIRFHVLASDITYDALMFIVPESFPWYVLCLEWQKMLKLHPIAEEVGQREYTLASQTPHMFLVKSSTTNPNTW